MDKLSKPNLTDLARGGMNIFTAPIQGPRKFFSHLFARRYLSKYRWARVWFGIDLTLIAIAILLLVTSLLSLATSPLPRQVAVSLAPVGAVRTGDIAEIAIAVKNHSPEPLSQVTLEIEPSRGFEIQGERSFTIGSLPREGVTELRVKGLFLGAVGKPTSVIAVARGKTKQDKDFSEPNSLALTASESAVRISFSIPPIVFTYNYIPVQIVVTSESSVPLDGLDFASSLTMEEDLTLLAPGQTMTIYSGFNPRAGDQTIDFAIKKNGAELARVQALTRGVPVAAQISAHVDSVIPGAPLVVQLKQTGDGEITSVETQGSSKLFVKELETFRGQTDLQLQTLAHPENLEAKDLALQIVAHLKIGSDDVPYYIAPITLTLSPRVALAAEARYWSREGDQLGRGPVPPRVGKETTYWIFAQPKTEFATLKNSVLEFELGSGVKLAPNTSLPAEWSITGETIKGLSLAPGDNPELGFAVMLTPTRDMIGKPATLIRAMRLVGEFDGTKPAAELGSTLTTDLSTDPHAQGKGIVQP